MKTTITKALFAGLIAVILPLATPALAKSNCDGRLWKEARPFGVQYGVVETFRLKKARLLDVRTSAGRKTKLDPTRVMVPTPIVDKRGSEVAINHKGRKVWIHRRYLRTDYYRQPVVSKRACTRLDRDANRSVVSACTSCYGRQVTRR